MEKKKNKNKNKKTKQKTKKPCISLFLGVVMVKRFRHKRNSYNKIKWGLMISLIFF